MDSQNFPNSRFFDGHPVLLLNRFDYVAFGAFVKLDSGERSVAAASHLP